MDLEQVEVGRWSRVWVLVALGAAGVAGACAETADQGAQVASSDSFCASVLPAVAGWLEAARAANPTPDDERYGGTATASGSGELSGGMNSAGFGVDYSAVQHQQFVNMMTLIDYDADGRPRPYLAESWEVSDDNTEITWRIRQDVFWHDGEPTDAHDVAFTYRVVTDPETGFANAAYWNLYDKGPEGVEIVDDFTVRMRLQPHQDFLDPWRSVSMLPEHLLGDVPRSEISQHPFGSQCPVGNGPFVFESHSPQDRWVFVANPAFPEALGGRPYLDRYVYRVIPEQTTQLTELLTGGTDMYTRVRPDQAQQVIDAPDVDLLRTPFRDYVMVAWNARRPQLADARVRRAITMATDREEIVSAIQQGYGTVANSSVPPFHWAYRSGDEFAVAHDPAGARALLEEAGWSDRDGDGVRENAEGVPLEISLKFNPNQARQDIAEIMQAQLADVGIRIQPEVVEFTALLAQVTDPEVRDFDGVVLGWVAEFKLDDTDLFHSERSDQPYAFAGIQNPEIDRLLETLTVTLDREEARGLWAEYQRELAREQPYTFFYYPDRLDGVSRRLRGVTIDARGEWLSAREWYVDPERR